MSEENEHGGVYDLAPAKHVAMYWQAPPEVMRAWFSGADPQVGSDYVVRVEHIAMLDDGSVSISLNFVPAR
ncbi:hypothetical protein KDX14_33170 [Burkholderia cenocepacia]|uniref:hypothetical protein n=1 Tax=Burkholderia cenocepacia TaxID=95486 RepID=UPI001BA1CCBD|nr:hypothetical protein [Burkholderia cenocepacia]MBR8074378.1 hypothetical protein [Burkholderia cenocepacia]